VIVLLMGDKFVEGSFTLFKYASSMNGAVMCVYCGTLWWLNTRYLPAEIRMSWWRQGVILAGMLFYGYFAVWSGWYLLSGAK
jgi:hypothetical protein